LTEPKVRSIRLFTDAIAKRRQENGGLTYLSDWQVHSAHLTSGAITSLASGYQTGPLYVPMPTGSGKTTGAIWGVVQFAKEYPDQRLCFMSKYTDAVEKVHAELAAELAKETVGYYHAEAFVNKDQELKKRIIVVTHNFIEHNRGRLDDRDLFVVDEAIYATGEASLRLKDFVDARSWATTHNIMPEAFTKLNDLATSLDQKLRADGKKYIAAPHEADRPWAKEIAFNLKLSDHSQTISDNSSLVAVQRFCEALLEGLVFLSQGQKSKDSYDPIFSAAVLGIPRIDKTVILSATGGMLYDIAGPFQQDSGSKDYWTAPSFRRLKMVQLSGPNLQGHYSTWKSQKNKDQVVAYVDWLIATIPEATIYMTMPKAVIDGCMRSYLNAPATGELNYPLKLERHNKTVYLSNHARSVGSNAFKDCDAVVYLWDNFLPSAVAVQRFHTLADEPITDDALLDANGGSLVGNYKRIREAQYLDNMMQQIGRGNVRAIDKDAIAGKMTAYVLTTNNDRFVRLAAQYPDCMTDKLEYDGIAVSQPTGRLARIIDYLGSYGDKQDVEAKSVEDALGFELRRYSPDLENNWDLMMLGYTYQKGGRGRGNSARFTYNKGNDKT
jgi:hypothetical protein